jgi:predicted flap endonuclease-1-like 5' DNA nuclease
MFHLPIVDVFVLTQEPAATGIPVWLWVLLGIIFLIVVMGLVIGSRTSERSSPTVRSTNVREGTDVRPQEETVRPEMIPQTGDDVLHDVAPPVATVQDVEGPINNDDLTVIHGITPNVAHMLIDAGITTFRQLAQTDRRALENMMITSGLEYSDPQTWPEQARLAEEGRWEELDAYRN